jgi:hypothetical protein
MFRKLFVFLVVLLLVVGFVVVLDAIMYSSNAGDSAVGSRDPSMESLDEEVEVSVPLSGLMRGHEDILFPGVLASAL